MYQKLKEAINRLASFDPDCAREQNGVGFAGCDTLMGHFLASRETWKLKWAQKAFRMIQKYKNTQIADIYPDIIDPSIEGDELQTPKITIDDLYSLDWSEPVFIQKVGKYLEKTSLPNGFWDLWKEKKDELKRLGFSVSKFTGNWELDYWYHPSNFGTQSIPEPNIVQVQSTPAISEPQITEVSAQIPEFQATEKVPEKPKYDLSPLYDYQQSHALNLIDALERNKVALDGSSTGTGKTPVALVTCRERKKKPFIVCPKISIPAWTRWCEKLGMEAIIVNYELIKMGNFLKPRVLTRGKNKGKIRYDSVSCPFIRVEANLSQDKYASKWIISWQLPEEYMLIFDEAHRCKNRDAINTQLLIAAKEAGCEILMLSATIGESPLKMFGVARVFNFYQKPWEFYNWAASLGCFKQVVNRSGQEAWFYDGNPKNMMELHRLIYDGHLGSRMRVETLIERGQFPEVQLLPEVFGFNNETDMIQATYDDMFKEIEELDAKTDKLKTNPLALRQKAQQKVELLKVAGMVELAENVIEEGNSVCIFVNYTQTLLALCEKLNTDCCIYGGNGAELNEKNRVRFQNNESRVIICNIQASRESIDLHDVKHEFPRVALISPTDNAQNLKQVFGRTHRAGGTNTIEYIVYAAGTIEERVCDNVKRKIKNIDALNDGDLELKNLF